MLPGCCAILGSQTSLADLHRHALEQSSFKLRKHVFHSCWQTLTAGVLLMQTIVVDARAHMLGRLASILAKQLLAGQQVVSLTPETLSSSSPLSVFKARLPTEAPLLCTCACRSGKQDMAHHQPVAMLCQLCRYPGWPSTPLAWACHSSTQPFCTQLSIEQYPSLAAGCGEVRGDLHLWWARPAEDEV